MKTEEIPVFDDMFDIWTTPWWQSPWAVAGMAVACSMLVILLYYLVRCWKNRPRKVDHYQRAQDQLKDIYPLLQHEEYESIKKAYVRLLQTMKEFFDNQYGLSTASKTDHEIGAYVQEYGVSVPIVEEWLLVIETIHHHSIQAKFERIVVAKTILAEDYAAVCDVFRRAHLAQKEAK